ncbi:MAG: nucleoside recognition domain-containing protein [Gemmatimonadota bacterium]|nr:nucleoside recognition domain-containing protein [Gemmatimonadota bacterium]
MLNYIWSGLIIASVVFALWFDVGDLTRDTYRNGQALPVELLLPEDYDPAARTVPVEIRVEPDEYRDFYGTDGAPADAYRGQLLQTREGRQLRFEAEAELPEPLATIREVSSSQEGELQGTLTDFEPAAAEAATGEPADAPPAVEASVRFEPVRFVKMNAIAEAALEFATTAAEIALGLIGVLALFLGLLKIAEESGIIHSLVRLVRPVLRPLFPDIPPDHPALGMIALNLTANIFGLGNAATPFGIKAMEELQELNPSEDTATNSMVMLLAMNTASVQLVPPVLLLALMGLQINQLIFAIILTTGLSLVVAVTAARLYGRMPGSRASDPHDRSDAGTTPSAAGGTD